MVCANNRDLNYREMDCLVSGFEKKSAGLPQVPHCGCDSLEDRRRINWGVSTRSPGTKGCRMIATGFRYACRKLERLK